MIVYIHGASATAESFTHIRQFVRDHTEEPYYQDYDSNQTIWERDEDAEEDE
jgi:hypothetical protein